MQNDRTSPNPCVVPVDLLQASLSSPSTMGLVCPLAHTCKRSRECLLHVPLVMGCLFRSARKYSKRLSGNMRPPALPIIAPKRFEVHLPGGCCRVPTTFVCFPYSCYPVLPLLRFTPGNGFGQPRPGAIISSLGVSRCLLLLSGFDCLPCSWGCLREAGRIDTTLDSDSDYSGHLTILRRS